MKNLFNVASITLDLKGELNECMEMRTVMYGREIRIKVLEPSTLGNVRTEWPSSVRSDLDR